jgi:uncharacterized damage-inducible protein DinB
MPVEFVGPASELDGLTMFLDEQRAAVLRKLDGLSEAEARRTATVSSFSMLTLVKHLAYVERRWFQIGIAGRDLPGVYPAADPDEELRIDPGDTVASIRNLYADITAESRAITAAVVSPDQLAAADRSLNVRWILLHMIEETARHAGHADIIRESIDGARGP